MNQQQQLQQQPQHYQMHHHQQQQRMSPTHYPRNHPTSQDEKAYSRYLEFINSVSYIHRAWNFQDLERADNISNISISIVITPQMQTKTQSWDINDNETEPVAKYQLPPFKNSYIAHKMVNLLLSRPVRFMNRDGRIGYFYFNNPIYMFHESDRKEVLAILSQSPEIRDRFIGLHKCASKYELPQPQIENIKRALNELGFLRSQIKNLTHEDRTIDIKDRTIEIVESQLHQAAQRLQWNARSYASNSSELMIQNKNLQTEIENHERQSIYLNSKLREMHDHMTRLMQERENLETFLQTNGIKDFAALQSKYYQLQGSLTKKEEIIASLSYKVNQSPTNIKKSHQTNLRTSNGHVERLTGEKQILESQRDSLNFENSRLNAENRQLRDDNFLLITQKKDLEKQNAGLKQDADIAKQYVSNNKRALEKNAKLEQEMDQLKKKARVFENLCAFILVEGEVTKI